MNCLLSTVWGISLSLPQKTCHASHSLVVNLLRHIARQVQTASALPHLKDLRQPEDGVATRPYQHLQAPREISTAGHGH